MDSPRPLQYDDFDRANAEDIEVAVGPDRTSIFLRNQFLTWIPTENWEEMKNQEGNEQAAKQAIPRVLADFMDNPEDYTEAFQHDE